MSNSFFDDQDVFTTNNAFSKITNKKAVELEQFGGREEDEAVFVGRTRTRAISISSPDNSPAQGTVWRCFPRY